MTRHQITTVIARLIGSIQRRCLKVIRESLKWLHLVGVIVLLYVCSMQFLEALIVVILMFEIGFEFTALDRLIEYNNKLRSWTLRKFSARRKKK
jgi:hypothetical protein